MGVLLALTLALLLPLLVFPGVRSDFIPELLANAALERDRSRTNLDRRSPRAVNGVPGVPIPPILLAPPGVESTDMLYPLALGVDIVREEDVRVVMPGLWNAEPKPEPRGVPKVVAEPWRDEVSPGEIREEDTPPSEGGGGGGGG